MICLVSAAIACAVFSTQATTHQDRVMWAAAALGWAAVAVLASRLG